MVRVVSFFLVAVVAVALARLVAPWAREAAGRTWRPRSIHPLPVVFVDAEGVAKRFELREDAFLRELAKTRDLPVFDATRAGYPERMRPRRTE